MKKFLKSLFKRKHIPGSIFIAPTCNSVGRSLDHIIGAFIDCPFEHRELLCDALIKYFTVLKGKNNYKISGKVDINLGDLMK